MKNIKHRIENVVQKATALMKRKMAHFAGSGRNAERYDWDAHFNEENRLLEEVREIDKDAGPGFVVGRLLSFQVGDGKAIYIIEKIRKRVVTLAYIPHCDMYKSPAVWQNDRGEHVIMRELAEQRVQTSDDFKRIFGR